MAIPTIVAAHVSKSGNIIPLYPGITGSPDTPAYPTAVNADATITINGVVTPCVRFQASVSGHGDPFIAYQPYSGTPPNATPITLTPSDVVTWSAPANWLQTTLGTLGPGSGTVLNCVGGWEPGVFGYYGFDSSVIPHTFWPGYLGAGSLAGGVQAFKNCLHRSPNPMAGALTSTADGIPLTFNSTGIISTPVFSSTPNGLDSRQYPAMPGVWTYICDEKAPGSPLVATLVGNQPSLVSAPVITPGTLVGGVEIGRKWEWTVSLGAGVYNSGLTLTLTAPTPHSSGQPFTHTNMFMGMPGDSAPPATLADDCAKSYLDMLTVAPGIAASPHRDLVRCWPFVSAARPSDMQPGSDFSWTQKARSTAWTSTNPGFTGARDIPVYGVQPYDLAVSPNIYCLTNWNGRCVTSDNLAIAPWMYRPADHGQTYDWLYDVNIPVKNCLCEFLTGPSPTNQINHNLASDQFCTFSPWTFSVVNSGGTATATAGGGKTVWVTGPNRFVTDMFASGLTNQLDVGRVNGFQLAPAGQVASIGDPNNIAIEQMGGTTKADGRPAEWICLNHAMDDAAITSWATRLRASTSVGDIVYIQISNEYSVSNGSTSVGNAWQGMASLMGFGWSGISKAVMQRGNEMWQIFESVWGADSASIKRIWQPWTVNSQYTIDGLTYAKANLIRIDYIAIAPYMNVESSPSWTMAAAAIVADDPRSIAHPSQGGLGIRMPIEGAIDLFRLDFKYKRNWNGPTSFIKAHQNAITSTGYDTVFPRPKVILYEGGPNEIIVGGVSRTTKVLRQVQSHDVAQHSYWYHFIQAFLQHCECPGPIGSEGYATGTLNNLCGPRSFGTDTTFICPDGADNAQVAQWAHTEWQGQPRGYGLANKFAATTPAFAGDGKSHAWENQAVGAQSIADWILVAAGQAPIIPPPPPPPPPTPSGRRRFYVAPVRRLRR